MARHLYGALYYFCCGCMACRWMLQPVGSRFRGPNGSGVMPSSIQLSKLEQAHIDWTLDLPGEGHSSPVLWAKSVYLTSMSPAAASFHVLAVDAESGKVNWSREVAYESFSKHDFNSFASPTPSVDEEGVYIAWARPDHFHVASLDHAGNWRWNRDLGPFEKSARSGCITYIEWPSGHRGQ